MFFHIYAYTYILKSNISIYLWNLHNHTGIMLQKYCKYKKKMKYFMFVDAFLE